jgi:hypothetical protein
VRSRTSETGWNRDATELISEVQYRDAANIACLAHRIDSRDKRGSGAGETASYDDGAKVIPNTTETDGISIGCS